MADEVERVAKGLSAAQREAVIGARHFARRGPYIPEGWYVYADKRVRYRLSMLRIAHDYLRPSNPLTAFGEKVRAHLKDQPQ